MSEHVAKPGEAAPDEAAQHGEAIVGGRPTDPSVRVTNSKVVRIYAGVAATLPVIGAAWGWVNNNVDTVKLCIICFTVIGLSLIFRNVVIDVVRLWLKSDPSRYNVR